MSHLAQIGHFFLKKLFFSFSLEILVSLNVSRLNELKIKDDKANDARHACARISIGKLAATPQDEKNRFTPFLSKKHDQVVVCPVVSEVRFSSLGMS